MTGEDNSIDQSTNATRKSTPARVIELQPPGW